MGLSNRKRRDNFGTRFLAAISTVVVLCVVIAVMAAVPDFALRPDYAPMPADSGAENNGGGANESDSVVLTSHSAVSAHGLAGSIEEPYAQRVAAGDNPAEYEPGFVLATLAEGVSANDALEALAAVPELAGISVAEVIDTVVRFELPAEVSVQKAVALAQAVDEIEAVQPNYRYYLTGAETPSAQSASKALATAASVRNATALQGTSLGDALVAQSAVNDPYYDDQWYIASIHADEAWDAIDPKRAATTTVAVIDAGFLTSQEDLVGNVAASYDATTKKNVIYPDNVRSSEVDHGTHCAGVIAATANNGKGIAGVADNVCKVLPVRVQDKNDTIYTSYLVQAYSYLASKQAKYNIRVANMSLGAPSSSRVTRMTDKAIYDAIQKGRDAGIVTVVAACNDDQEDPPYYAYPSDFDNVISVIALDNTSSNSDGVKRASCSNYNVSDQIAKNISAPGTSILSLLAKTNKDWTSPYYGTLYGTKDGTSMAAPVVAGVMGLMFAVNPELTANEATSKLYSTAKDLTKSSGTSGGWDVVTGFGEVNAMDALSTERAYLTGATAVSVGKAKTLAVKIAGAKQTASEWTWSSSNPKVATVSANGQVSGVKGGQVIITAKKGSLEARQVVTVQIPVKSLEVTIPQSSYVYTGKVRKPVPTVSLNGKQLTENHDYTVSYKSNVNAGTAYVVVKGVAPYYTGTVKKAFKITKASIGKASIVLSPKTLSYNGEKQKPKVIVYDIKRNKAVKLKKGVDYKVSGSGVVRGTGKLKITAKNACANFKGSTTRTFRVK